jgi:hypothetical protein
MLFAVCSESLMQGLAFHFDGLRDFDSDLNHLCIRSLIFKEHCGLGSHC